MCAAALVAPPVGARTKKGDKLLKQGEKAEAQKQYDQAIEYYSQAVQSDPHEPAYLIADQRARSEAAEAHVALGRQLQQKQQLQEALAQFQKAFLDDPSSQIALQEIAQTTMMIKEKAKLPPGTPVLTPAERARQEIEKRINSLEGPPTLRPINNEITSLKLNNQPPRVLYESVCKLAGINVLFDPTGIEPMGGTRNFNLDLNNVTLDEALNYVALVTHTFWKPISRNAIFVTQDTEPKRQEYQDEVVKVFYIQNASNPTEFTDIYNAIRTGAKLMTGLFQIPSQNAIIARGSPDVIALVEKLVHDLDKPKPEIVLDVIVMEVARDKTRTLGAALAGLTNGLNVPILFTPRNPVFFNTTSTTTGTTTATTGLTTAQTTATTTATTTGTTTTTTTGTTTTTTTGTTTTTTTGTTTTATTGTTTTATTGLTTTETTGTTATTTTANQFFIPLSQVGHVSTNDFSISLPGALISALLQDNSTHVLQRPQVRVTDGGKASLKIGSKIPYVSGSLNSAVATPGAIPYATTQFQEVDVGTNIDLQLAHVNGPEDISLHIKVEVSSVIETETIAGIQQPVIGQRVNEADIRMKDGEVSVLGGLSTEENDLSVAGIPGVTNIPLLGYLFGTKTKTNNKDEILVALTPHIVRAPDLSDVGQAGVSAGTERETKVRRSQPAAGAPLSTAPKPRSTPLVPSLLPPQPAAPSNQAPGSAAPAKPNTAPPPTPQQQQKPSQTNPPQPNQAIGPPHS